MKPNPIDFDKVFKEFAEDLLEDENWAVIATVVVAFMTYFVVIILARRADKKDASRRVSLEGFYWFYFLPLLLYLPYFSSFYFV